MDEKEFEIAESVTTALIENGVKAACSKVKARDPSFPGTCDDCLDPIPEKRLDTGATTCLDCQQIRERTQAQYKR